MQLLLHELYLPNIKKWAKLGSSLPVVLSEPLLLGSEVFPLVVIELCFEWLRVLFVLKDLPRPWLFQI